MIVGIDFGTSTTVVRYRKDNSDIVETVKDDGLRDIIPSAIFRVKDKNTEKNLYGYAALNARYSGLEGDFITNFKMGLLDTDEETQNKKKTYIREFMSYIYQRFSQEIQGVSYDSLNVYISYPAKWSDSFILFMKEAVSTAGFGPNVIGVNEPKAATYNILNKNLDDLLAQKILRANTPINVLMLDMGAGTSDIVIFRMNIDNAGNIETTNLLSYPRVDNKFLCGGREVDQYLSDFVLEYIRKESKLDSNLDDDFFPIIDAKRWKDDVVSPQLKLGRELHVPQPIVAGLKWIPNGKKIIDSFSFSRDSFETLTCKHWVELYSLISSAVGEYEEKYNIGAEDIDMVFLTGGHSQWYIVPSLFSGVGIPEILEKEFKRDSHIHKLLNFKKIRANASRIRTDIHPHECVAIGLCMQDQKIKLANTAANSIWIQLEINGVKNEPQCVINASDMLPKDENCVIDLGKIQGDWDSEKRNDFRGYLYIYTGENLETALCQKKFIELNVSLFKFFLFGSTYFVSANCEVKLTEEGLVDISGYVKIEKDNFFASPDYITFKNSDFVSE